MARQSPFSFPVRPSIADVRHFSDPLIPGIQIPIALRASAGIAQDARIGELAAELTQRYVTGDAQWQQSAGERGKGPTPVFLPANNAQIQVTTSMATLIAVLCILEADAKRAGDTEEPPYSPEEWLAMSATAPSMFGGILAFAEEMRSKARGDLGNSSAAMAPTTGSAPGETTSAPLFTTGLETIPAS